MTLFSFVRGHLAAKEGETWVWAKDGSRLQETDPPCARCGRLPSEKGHDDCIRDLPGVSDACCGHAVDEPYIRFNDEDVFRQVVAFLRQIRP